MQEKTTNANKILVKQKVWADEMVGDAHFLRAKQVKKNITDEDLVSVMDFVFYCSANSFNFWFIKWKPFTVFTSNIFLKNGINIP